LSGPTGEPVGLAGLDFGQHFWAEQLPRIGGQCGGNSIYTVVSVEQKRQGLGVLVVQQSAERLLILRGVRYGEIAEIERMFVREGVGHADPHEIESA
jgi:hypothetical protein